MGSLGRVMTSGRLPRASLLVRFRSFLSFLSFFDLRSRLLALRDATEKSH